MTRPQDESSFSITFTHRGVRYSKAWALPLAQLAPTFDTMAGDFSRFIRGIEQLERECPETTSQATPAGAR